MPSRTTCVTYVTHLCDALDVDLGQAAHHLLVHLLEIAHIRIRQLIVALDGVLSASTLATSPSRSLPVTRASRRRRWVKVREGTKGGLLQWVRGAGRQGQHVGGKAGEGAEWRKARMVGVWRGRGGGEERGMCGSA
jgi:hypothetical protein